MSKRLEGFPLNIRILQEYIAFARILNFTAAAQELYISQSTLSAHMQKLENDLGVGLINHGSKPSLTPSGKLFLQYAENIVCLFLEAIDATKQYESKSSSLVIEEPQNAGLIFEATIRAFNYFSDAFPAAKLTLRPIFGNKPLSALQEGIVDVVKSIDLHAWDSPEFLEKAERLGIEVVPVSQEVPIVWMQSDHPLASKANLSIDDLRKTPILVPADVRYDDWRALMRSWFESKGIVPTFSLQVTETLMEFYMTKPGKGVFLLPESMATGKNLLPTRNLVSREISDKSCIYYVSLASLKANKNPLLVPYRERIAKELLSIKRLT